MRRNSALDSCEAFGKNEQVKKVFRAFFIPMAGLVLARVVDPATAQQIVGLITGMRGMTDRNSNMGTWNYFY